MARIDIRGVIVPSDYDVSFLFPYIQKGLITPESYVRKQIEANKDDTLDLYINSQGGSVFAGNEMINALQDRNISVRHNSRIVVPQGFAYCRPTIPQPEV